MSNWSISGNVGSVSTYVATLRSLSHNIVGTTEIADRLVVSRATVARWIERRVSTGFPEPVAHLRSGYVFDMVEVRAWYTMWKSTRR